MKENHKVDELLGNIAKLKSAIDEKDEIIVGLAKSKEEALKAVQSCKYPPQGKRGVGLARAQGYGEKFNQYVN